MCGSHGRRWGHDRRDTSLNQPSAHVGVARGSRTGKTRSTYETVREAAVPTDFDLLFLVDVDGLLAAPPAEALIQRMMLWLGEAQEELNDS